MALKWVIAHRRATGKAPEVPESILAHMASLK